MGEECREQADEEGEEKGMGAMRVKEQTQLRDPCGCSVPGQSTAPWGCLAPGLQPGLCRSLGEETCTGLGVVPAPGAAAQRGCVNAFPGSRHQHSPRGWVCIQVCAVSSGGP